MQKSHRKRGPVGGKLVDAGQHLLAIPGFIPNMVEGVGRGINSAFGYFLQARTADGAGDPPTVAPTFEKDCRAPVAPMDRLAFGRRENRFASRDHGRQPAVIRLVGHAQNHFRRPSHGACYRTRLASGWPIIDASERRRIDPGAEIQRWPRVLEFLREELKDDETFAQRHETRRNDLLVHLALTQFPGSPKYRSLPKSIQADIKAFFRNHAAAQEEGRRLLFATGDRAKIRQDVEAALTAPLGAMRGDRWFRFRSSTLPRLPSRLRVLVGCAEVLQGGVDACDFVDIDTEAPRIAMLTCDDVESLIPFVVESVTVDLARQKVSANKHDPYAAPVYFKSRFLPPDDEARDRQIAGEQILVSTGLFKPGGPEPSWQSIEAALKT